LKSDVKLWLNGECETIDLKYCYLLIYFASPAYFDASVVH